MLFLPVGFLLRGVRHIVFLLELEKNFLGSLDLTAKPPLLRVLQVLYNFEKMTSFVNVVRHVIVSEERYALVRGKFFRQLHLEFAIQLSLSQQALIFFHRRIFKFEVAEVNSVFEVLLLLKLFMHALLYRIVTQFIFLRLVFVRFKRGIEHFKDRYFVCFVGFEQLFSSSGFQIVDAVCDLYRSLQIIFPQPQERFANAVFLLILHL